MYNDTITMFNEKDGIWYPYVIYNAYLNIDLASNQAKTGIESADKARLHIKYRKDSDKLLIGDQEYLKPKEWLKQDQLDRFVTFVDTKSFFINGSFPEDKVDDEEYGNGFFSHMKRNHDDCFEVSNVAQFTVIPHFEIGGR